MNMSKKIWMPVIIGVMFGALTFFASTANFLIPIGDHTSIGVGEIFTMLSAALGGPIAVISMLLVTYVSVVTANIELITDPQSFYVVLADFTAHLCAMLVVAICYYRFPYPRARQTGIFLVGWWLTVSVYYLVLLPLSVALLNLVSSGLSATFPSFFHFVPEFLGTAVITTIIWIALPARYRRPQWIEPKQMPDQGGKVHDE